MIDQNRVQSESPVAPPDEPASIVDDVDVLGQEEIVAAAVFDIDVAEVGGAPRDVDRRVREVQIALLQEETKPHACERRTRPRQPEHERDDDEQTEDDRSGNRGDLSDAAHCQHYSRNPGL